PVGDTGRQQKKPLEPHRVTYLRSTRALLEGEPSTSALRTHLAYLRKARTSYHQQCKKIRNDKQKKDNVLAVIALIDEATTLISTYMVKRLHRLGVPGGGAYAYGPREGVHYDVHTPGRDHFQLALPLVQGRMVRQMGDLLCKSSREFWGLRVTDDPNRISCWACLKRMLTLLDALAPSKNESKSTSKN